MKIRERRGKIEIDTIIRGVKNHTIPDVDRLFSSKLRLDMTESNLSKRVLKYFMLCNQLIEKHGLVACFEGGHGSKEKCKLLLESLSPGELKSDAFRFQVPAARSDECKLHDLILEKALEHRDFFRRKRTRYKEQFTKPEKTMKLPDKKYSASQRGRIQLGTSGSTDPRTRDGSRVMKPFEKPFVEQARPAAPNYVCLKCGGPHYVVNCPTATADEKKDLPKHFHAKRHEQGRMKRIKERLGVVISILLNDVLELRYCVDTGSDWCLIIEATSMILFDLTQMFSHHAWITPSLA